MIALNAIKLLVKNGISVNNLNRENSVKHYRTDFNINKIRINRRKTNEKYIDSTGAWGE